MNLSRVVFCGDSMTDNGGYDFYQAPSQTWHNLFGVDLTNSWTDIVARTLKFPCVNSAVSGGLLKDIANNVNHYILQFNPTIVFLEGGYNDWGTNREDANTIAGYMDATVKACKDAGVEVVIVWFPVNYEFNGWKATGSEVQPLALLPAKYQAIADKYNVRFINFEGTALGTSPAVDMMYKLQDGGIHHSPKGHLYVAKYIIDYICNIFGIPNEGRVKQRLKTKKEG